jgi:hypothetical protein
MRYGGTACFISKRCSPVRGLLGSLVALMTARMPFGVRMLALYITRTSGEFWTGIKPRAWMASAWVNRKG